jgi:hypothetical protein
MRQTIGVGVERISWSVTAAMFALVAVTLFLSGYVGYGGVFLVVAASAAVNTLPAHDA